MISLVLAVSLCLIVVAVSVDSVADGTADTTDTTDTTEGPTVTIDKSSVSMVPEDKETLTATVSIDNYTGNITWSSDNPNVVSVTNSGKTCTITAKAVGSATIKATVEGGNIAECKVTVTAVTIELGKSSVVLIDGETYRMDVTVTPSRVLGDLKVTPSNSTVAQWSEYTHEINANAEGTSTLTFEVRGTKVTCSVEVIGGSIDVYANRIDIDIDRKNGVTLSGHADNYSNKLSGMLTATVSSEGMKDGSLSSAAESHLNKCLSIVADRASWAPLEVEIDGGAATKVSIGQSIMSVLSKTGAVLSVSSDNGGVALDSASVKGLGGSSWSFSLNEVENTTSIEGAKLYQVSMKSGDRTVTSVSGKATVSIPLDDDEALDPMGISLFTVSTNGTTSPLTTSYDAIHGVVSVTVSSFGTIGMSSNGGGNGNTGTSTLSYVALAVIIIIAVLCVVMCYRYLRM